jgi:hypothetical protein
MKKRGQKISSYCPFQWQTLTHSVEYNIFFCLKLCCCGTQGAGYRILTRSGHEMRQTAHTGMNPPSPPTHSPFSYCVHSAVVGSISFLQLTFFRLFHCNAYPTPNRIPEFVPILYVHTTVHERWGGGA